VFFVRLIKVAILFHALLAGAAHGEVFREDVRTWRRARTVASGQQVWSLQSSYQHFTDRFSADGRVVPLGQSYTRTVSWNQILQADTQSQAEIKKYMDTNGIHGGEIAATSTYEVDRREIGFNFNWAYGLTRNWMIGVQIPFRFISSSVNHRVETSPQMAQATGFNLQSKELHKRIRQLAEQELVEEGYDQIPARKQFWRVGDVSLLNQFSLGQTYNWAWSLQQVVRFPTAQKQSVSDYIQTSRDEGPVDLGVTSLVDYQLRSILLGARLGYVAQLPDTARMRSSGRDSGSTQVDQSVKRNLGDWIWGAVDVEYRITRRLDVNAEHSYLQKGKDKYSGNVFSSSEYALLAEDTDQQLHQSRVGLLFRLSPSTSRSGVTNKWVASLDYSHPWIGRNSSHAARTSLEIMNYF
jgi:hypothetical protein